MQRTSLAQQQDWYLLLLTAWHRSPTSSICEATDQSLHTCYQVHPELVTDVFRGCGEHL